jgi:lysophospholipase L1-like esterase
MFKLRFFGNIIYRDYFFCERRGEMQKVKIGLGYKKFVSVFLVLVVLLVTVFGASGGKFFEAYGADESGEASYHYVALGDSIVAGFGLANPDTEGCVSLFSSYFSMIDNHPITASNLGVTGYETSDIIDLLGKPDIQKQISNATIITLNIGGNNLLQPVMASLVNKYGLTNNDELRDYLSSNYLEAVKLLSLRLSDFAPADQQAIQDGVVLFQTEFKQIIDLIRKYAPYATMAVSTIYNPFPSSFGTIDIAIHADAEILMPEMNKTIWSYAEAGNYSVVDIYTSFKESDKRVTNFSFSPLDFFHPNISGHQLIATKNVLAVFGHKKVYKVEIDGEANETFTYSKPGGNTTLQLPTARVYADFNVKKSVVWSITGSSEIATLKSDSGSITFTGKEGAIILTATSEEDPAVSDSVIINVENKSPITVSVNTPISQVYITKGKKLSLPIELYQGNDIVTKSVATTFKSSNKKIVTVDKKGKIKGIKAGTAKITVTTKAGKSLVIKITVVKKAVKLKKFKISGTPKSMNVGKNVQLKIKLSQPKATNLIVTYKSSKPKVVSVDKAGRITAHKKGSAVITVKVGSIKVKTSAITVK